MGTDPDEVIDRLFVTLLQKFQQAIESSNERGSGFAHKSVTLLYYYFQKINIVKAESYIMSPEWIVNKGATIKMKKIINVFSGQQLQH